MGRSDESVKELKGFVENKFVSNTSAGNITVPEDYNGDSRLENALYRNGIWYVSRSNGSWTASQFRITSDVPVPRAFVP